LLCVSPELALADDRNAPAQGPERLAGATEQPTGAGAHSVDDKIAIIAVQQKNKTDMRMIGVQTAQSLDQVVVIGGTVAYEYDIDWSRLQGLQAIGKLAATAGNLCTRLAAKSAAQ
jgi:hypothetical protein